jgi:hypothetical protein
MRRRKDGTDAIENVADDGEFFLWAFNEGGTKWIFLALRILLGVVRKLRH